MPGGSIRVDNGDSETRAKLPHRPAHKVICQVEPVFMDRAEREANANILAAAPDLLAAAVAALDVLEKIDPSSLDKVDRNLRITAIVQLKPAIAKAEGTPAQNGGVA